MIAVGFLVFVCFLVGLMASRAGDWDWQEWHTWPGWAKVALFPLGVFLFLAGADGDPGPGSPWYEHRREQERAVLAGQAHISTLTADHQVQFCARYGWPVPPVIATWAEIRRTKGTRAANRYLEEQNRLLQKQQHQERHPPQEPVSAKTDQPVTGWEREKIDRIPAQELHSPFPGTSTTPRSYPRHDPDAPRPD